MNGACVKGEGLIRKYVELLEECESEPNYAYHLKELLGKGKGAEKKRRAFNEKR